MKKFRLAATALVLAAGCATKSPAPSSDAAFESQVRQFLETHFAVRPDTGVALGWHQYDGKFALWSGAALEAEEARLRRFDGIFHRFQQEELSPANRLDCEILWSAIAEARWQFDIGTYSKNPMVYAGNPDVLIYFMRDFKPLNERVRDATAVLQKTHEFLTEARKNLQPVLARPLVDTAIQVADGSASFLENEALTAAREADDAGAVREFEQAATAAAREKRAFADWLRQERLPAADDHFAIGDHAYRAMLAAEQITMSPGEILNLGLQALEREQRRFTEAARDIDPNRKPADVYRDIQRDHPTEQSLIPDTAKNLESIRQFVLDHHLVTIPSEVRARTEETPPPQRATGFASMSTPGPFETRATEAYYYVTPAEADWSAQRKEEWLTAFNYYTTDVVSMHEAYPGHYVQFLKLNASGASTVAKIFTSYAFTEGWAHYCEQLLIDEGFPDPVPGESNHELRAAKYRLAQSAEALLRYCRLVCSIRLHTQGMTVKEATHFFMDNCHYAEEPSRQEAVRGTFDPGYLFYALGKLQILKLREDWRKQEGDAYRLQRFHDEFLSHGAPPIAVVRRLMLKDSRLGPEILPEDR
jgi:uncharacterized protein (DUF885 family)